MKKILLPVILFGLGLNSMAQRNVDLEVELLAPTTNLTLNAFQSFDISIEVTNIGSENINTSDTLRFYQLLNGDTVEFMDNNYMTVTNLSIPPGQSIVRTIQFVFTNSTPGEEVTYNQCWFVLPVNASNAISEVDLSNNETDCRIYTITDQTASLEHLSMENAIYPNPATDFVNFSMIPDGKVKITALDGTIVKELMPDNQRIDVSRLDTGMYIMTFALNNQAYSTRLVVTK